MAVLSEPMIEFPPVDRGPIQRRNRSSVLVSLNNSKKRSLLNPRSNPGIVRGAWLVGWSRGGGEQSTALENLGIFSVHFL